MADNVFISLISAAAGVTATFITVRYKGKPIKPKAKDRVDTAFDMYEQLLKQLNAEIDRKDDVILKLTIENESLRKNVT